MARMETLTLPAATSQAALPIVAPTTAETGTETETPTPVATATASTSTLPTANSHKSLKRAKKLLKSPAKYTCMIINYFRRHVKSGERADKSKSQPDEKSLENEEQSSGNSGPETPLDEYNKDNALIRSMASDELMNRFFRPVQIDRLQAKKHSFRGNVFMSFADYTNAVREFQKAIKCNPLESKYVTKKAFCYLKLEKFDKCIRNCKKALELNAEDKSAMNIEVLARQFMQLNIPGDNQFNYNYAIPHALLPHPSHLVVPFSNSFDEASEIMIRPIRMGVPTETTGCQTLPVRGEGVAANDSNENLNNTISLNGSQFMLERSTYDPIYDEPLDLATEEELRRRHLAMDSDTDEAMQVSEYPNVDEASGDGLQIVNIEMNTNNLEWLQRQSSVRQSMDNGLRAYNSNESLSNEAAAAARLAEEAPRTSSKAAKHKENAKEEATNENRQKKNKDKSRNKKHHKDEGELKDEPMKAAVKQDENLDEVPSMEASEIHCSVD